MKGQPSDDSLAGEVLPNETYAAPDSAAGWRVYIASAQSRPIDTRAAPSFPARRYGRAMKTLPDLAPTATARQRKVGDIADWYKGDASVEEQKQLGMDVVVVVDHVNSIIRVEAHDPRFGGATRRTPIEERMEFDYEVLDFIKKALRNPNVAVILDSSDIAGRLSYGSTVSRGRSARLTVVDIDSGEVVEERTVMKSCPEFPQDLKMRLLAYPGGADAANVVARTFVAETFVSAYLRMPA